MLGVLQAPARDLLYLLKNYEKKAARLRASRSPSSAGALS